MATEIIDLDHPLVREFVATATHGLSNSNEQLRALFTAVRDEIRYDPYNVQLTVEDMRASTVLREKVGFCISKAVLLAAGARILGIPSRLGFADVKNHLASPKLLSMMNTDLFVFHGFTELWLEARWVKATPAFNRTLCEKIGVPVLNFDGATDAMLQQADSSGKRFMEYVLDRGSYPDVPLSIIRREFQNFYPDLMDGPGYRLKGKFENEVSLET